MNSSVQTNQENGTFLPKSAQFETLSSYKEKMEEISISMDWYSGTRTFFKGDLKDLVVVAIVFDGKSWSNNDLFNKLNLINLDKPDTLFTWGEEHHHGESSDYYKTSRTPLTVYVDINCSKTFIFQKHTLKTFLEDGIEGFRIPLICKKFGF